MKVTISRGRSMVLGVMTGLTAHITKESGRWISKMEWRFSFLRNRRPTLGSIGLERNTASGSPHNPTASHSVDNSTRTGKAGMENMKKNRVRLKGTISMGSKVASAPISLVKMPYLGPDSG